MARILRSPLARDDLIEIWAYITSESSPSIADRFLSRIFGALELLGSAPLIGRERPEFPGSPRSIVVRPYIIFYEPLSEGDGIAIWRVLHGARRMEDMVRRPACLE